MASVSRSLLVATTALVVAAPAYGANGDAPGLLKKDPPATAQAPAVTPDQPAMPIPAKAPAATKAPTPARTNAARPVTKGTIKKALTGLTVATRSAHPGGRAVGHSRGSRSAATTATTRTPTRPHPTGASTRATKRNAAARRSAAAAAAASRRAAAAAEQRARRDARAAVRRARAHRGGAAAPAKPAPLTTISRAADRVVQVIPGAVVLALAGLAALVLLLIVRSWVTERRRGKALVSSYGITVEALATAIEAKDLTTGDHIERVRRLGLLLAGAIVPREARDRQMAYGFLLHDIGKLAVPDEILRAPGRLSDEQWALMRRHPEEGVRMLAAVPFLDKALDVVRHHHERWDGGGYPDGLAGQQIPLWARIFSVVDALDAMTADRPYRPGRSYEDALLEIRRNAGTQFDPAVVEALEGLDPAAVKPLLEPHQVIDATVTDPLAELPAPSPLVAA